MKMLRPLLRKSLLLILIGVTSVGCEQKSRVKHLKERSARGPLTELISTRAEEDGPLRVIVRLPATPLAGTTKEDRAAQAAIIAAEQNNLRDKLTAISSDIRVIYTYQFVLNALYLVIPSEVAEEVQTLFPQGTRVELATTFRRPEAVDLGEATPAKGDLQARNSVKFIGADQLHDQGLKGRGVRVGVIDTGIDYTHAMLGGSGLIDDYKKTNPSEGSDHYPNKKVVGGYDFVGTEYDGGSPMPHLRIPKPDTNPIDEAGHGSHVAGTIAGVGNGTTSYTGVAPEATLYALKVFGRDGSTDDAVVIAALEFAANPDGNAETEDQLDVVNLSLGSPYGTPKLLYSEAIGHLNGLGTMIVASAGNSGNNSYITGAPGVSAEALSVAASIDDMDHNWHFNAAVFKGLSEEVISEMAEATFTRPLKTLETFSGELIYVGKAGSISSEQASQLKGRVALIDRGEVAFYDKITNALNAGAIGAVVINDIPGTPLPMGGGRGTLDIPAIMISIEPGQKVREHLLKGGTASVDLKSDRQFAKPELIDTITGFSSRGPRSEDSLIKPEISAPGSKIISAKVGGGQEVVPMSGTSMAAPHMAGVIALLKQARPQLTPDQLKSLTMQSAKSLKTPEGSRYPIAQQGAGRVRVPEALKSTMVVTPASLSLGRQEVQKSKTLSRTLTLKNLKDKEISLSLEPQLMAEIEVLSPRSLKLQPLEERSVEFRFRLKAPTQEKYAQELDGFLVFKDEEQNSYSVPLLVVALKVSDVVASPLKVRSTSAVDSVGSVGELTLKNRSPHAGSGYLFQLLGKDALKADQGLQRRGLSQSCDLESVGYRTLLKAVDGRVQPVLQMALKLYNPLTSWNSCEFSVQIDVDGDGIADQELAGLDRQNTQGLGKGMASVLLDAVQARKIRKDYHSQLGKTDKEPKLDFTPSVLSTMELLDFGHSSLMIAQAPLSALKTLPGKNLRVKIGALSYEMDAIEADDYLGEQWLEFPLDANAQTVKHIPEMISVAGFGKIEITLTKGEGNAPLILYTPTNRGALSSAKDGQAQMVDLIYSDED